MALHLCGTGGVTDSGTTWLGAPRRPEVAGRGTYLPNQYALFSPVAADGTYTVANVPSGTYALAFLGCNGGNPSDTVPDPEAPTTEYRGMWWDGAFAHIDQSSNGGPDPIAQGATLVTLAPGQNLTGYDRCFGCTALVISDITPGIGSLTVAVTAPGLVTPADAQSGVAAQASLSYTATCTSSTGGKPGSASGSASPIVVTGLTPGATYTCLVTASDGQTIVATSAASSSVIVLDTSVRVQGSAIGALPFTGSSSSVPLAEIGLTLLGLGLGAVILTRRRRTRRVRPGHNERRTRSGDVMRGSHRRLRDQAPQQG